MEAICDFRLDGIPARIPAEATCVGADRGTGGAAGRGRDSTTWVSGAFGRTRTPGATAPGSAPAFPGTSATFFVVGYLTVFSPAGPCPLWLGPGGLDSR